MATQAQSLPIDRAAINRQNATHSTGPKTPEGKEKVRNNALTHGLSSREVFIGKDEVYDFEILLSQLLDNWCPATQEETRLVVHLRDMQWRLESIPALHINLMTLATEEHMEEFEAYSDNPQLQRSMARTAGYRANMKAFEQFSRHEGRLEPTIAKLEAQLTDIIVRRQERERIAKMEQALAAAKRPASTTNQSQAQPIDKTKPAEPAITAEPRPSVSTARP